ncbi:MAG: DUF3344 domain-containing protein [Halobacteriota archaeon]
MKNRKKNEGKRAVLCAVLTAALVLSAMTMAVIGIGGAGSEEVTRSIEPDSVAPGEDVTVTIAFTTPEDLYYLWLRDHVPLGWDVTDMEVNEGPQPFTTDYLTLETMGKVIFAWVDIGAGTQIEVQYTLHVPTGAEEGAYTLAGDIGTGIGEVIATIPEGTVTVKEEQPYDVNLDVDEEEKTTEADVTATYYLTVENAGTNGDTYGLSVTSMGADFAWLNKTSVSLGAGESGVVELNVSSFLAGDYDTTVEASSTTQPGVSDDVTVTTTVNPYYEVDLGVSPEGQTVEPDENATYTLTVTNLGNTEDTFNLAAEIPGGVSAQLSKAATSSLGHGENDTALLNVSSTIVGEYTVNVTATSQCNPSVSDTITTTTNVSVAPRPDLIVTGITLNCGYLFANESNTVNATIKNNGTADAGAFDVSFSAGAFSEGVRISGLAMGASEEVTVTDSTLRNAGESVTITVIADCNGEVNELDETNNESSIIETVVNNGYKSKSFAGLPSLVLLEHDKFNGSIVYTVGNSSKVELAPADTTTTGLDITIPSGATVQNARLYVYWYDSWYSAVHGDADLEVTFDGHSFTTPGASYTDGKGFGSYNYPKGTYAYDVTSDVSGTGTYTATIENRAPNTNTVLTGQLLLVVYEDATESEMEYWITEGCDLLKADSNYCVSPAEAIANVTFEGTIEVANKSARLITVVAQGNELGTDLSFNEQVWEDVWQTPEGSSKIDIDDRSVTGLRTSGNVVDFRDTGTMGMQASNAILVVESVPPITKVNVSLLEGENMFGVPLNVSDWTLPGALTSIDGKYPYISYYNATSGVMEYFDPLDPVGSTLKALEPGAGYLITMSEDATASFEGTKLIGLERSFKAGNNMFSIPYGVVDETLPAVLTSIDGKYTYISYYNATSGVMEYFDPLDPVGSTLKALEPGAGYLITMSEDAMFIPDMGS